MSSTKELKADAFGRRPRLVRPNKLTAAFLDAIIAEPKLYEKWHANAVASYKRTLRAEPMPGIWPKYTARSELAMLLHQIVEEGGRAVPASFRATSVEVAINDIDFYAVAEAFLSDSLIAETNAGQRSKGPRR